MSAPTPADPQPEGPGNQPPSFGRPSPALLERADRGYARFLVWDTDPGSKLVMDFEARPVELSAAGGFKIDADNQSEIKLAISFTSTKERILVRS